MNSRNCLSKREITWGAAALLALVGAGCSGPSTYNSSANPPIAVAHAIGAKPTSAAGADPLEITVRSRSQVTLTGNASDGGAGSIGTFAWSQTDSNKVALLYQDADTVTFTAPAVASETTLNFTLTVTTSGNASATKHVNVKVEPANDPNQFLAPPANTPHKYKVAVTTLEGMSGLSADAPICVTENRTIHYIQRDGNPHDLALDPIKKDSKWAKGIDGAADALGSFSNPAVVFDIPALNQDDIAYKFNNPVAGESESAASARLAQQLVPSDVDSASLQVSATASAGTCAAGTAASGVPGKKLKLQVLDQSGNAVGQPATASAAGIAVTSATYTPDLLVSQTATAPQGQPAVRAQYETAATAAAYYDAIDPAGKKLTLTQWLNENCFVASAKNYGADAHSVYTNNYDLGFGRDMYFTSCKSGPHAGDMASVVLNYGNVEGAASKLNPVIAVAMEYSADPDAATGGRNARRFPKFYVFAPDDRTGEFMRVASANFDHRGEKYVPGACVMCHGGNLPGFPANFVHAPRTTATSYSTVADPSAAQGSNAQLGVGDTDSVFMPWDLDSFLYSDTDPSFVGLSVDKANYTRASQEAPLKKLNQLAYCTYQPALEPQQSGQPIDRFAASRRLVAQWYGGKINADGSTVVDTACAQSGVPTASLLPGSYSDAAVPAGWSGKTAAGAVKTPPTTSDEIYEQVYARNCRSCHTQDATPQFQFSDYASFIGTFSKPTANTASGLGLQYVFQDGKMPLARLTMDRFWVDFDNGTSAASVLAAHVQALNGATNLYSDNAAVPVGKPVVFLTATWPSSSKTYTPDTAPTVTSISRFGGVSIDASKSFFIEDYAWTLCVKSSADCADAPVAGSSSAVAGFSSSALGSYQLTLAATSDAGVSAQPQFAFRTQNSLPSLVNCPPSGSNVRGTAGFGARQAVDLSTCVHGGDEPPQTPLQLLIKNPLTGAFVTSVADASLNWKADAVATYDAVNGYVYAIGFSFNAAVTADPTTGKVTTLDYEIVDFDGESVAGTLELDLSSALTAGSHDYSVAFVGSSAFPATASTYQLPISALNNVIFPTTDTAATLIVPPNLGALPAGVTPPGGGATQFPLGGSAPASECAVAVAGTCPSPVIAYTAASGTFITCDINGNDITNGTGTLCTPDTFYFYLLSGDQATTSANTGKVTVKVNATTSFSRTGASPDIYSIVSTDCSGCHTSGGSAQAYWQVDGASAANTYNSIRGADPTTNPGNRDWTQVKVNGSAISDRTQAAFYNNVCDSNASHYGTYFHATTQECTTILQWLEEGARND